MDIKEIIGTIAGAADKFIQFKSINETIGVGDGLHVCTTISTDGEPKLLDQYVQSSDTRLAKIIAATTSIAKAHGLIEINDSMPYSIASIADDTAARIKTAKDIAIGNIDTEEVAQQLVDRAAARLVTFIDRCVNTVATLSKQTVMREISTVHPELTLLIPSVNCAIDNCSSKVKDCIYIGIKAVTNAAHSIVNKIAVEAKSAFIKLQNIQNA